MVIFTSNINILQHINNAVVYNLSSYMQAEQLNLLPPFVMEYDEYTFAMNYYNYIFSNVLK